MLVPLAGPSAAAPGAYTTIANIDSAIWAAFTPDGSKAYVATGKSTGPLHVIETATNTVSTTITTSGQPIGIAVSPDGTTAFALLSKSGANSIAVINTATDAIDDSIPLPFSPNRMALTPDGTSIYVSYSTNSVVKVDVATKAVSSPITVGFQPVGLVVSPDGTSVYVAARQANAVSTPNPTPRDPQGPANAKGKAPQRIKQDGVTVITGRNARTTAGELIRTRITGNSTAQGEVRYYRVIRGPQGKVSLRTYGYPNLKIVVVQYAPGTDTYRPYRQRTVYVDGVKR